MTPEASLPVALVRSTCWPPGTGPVAEAGWQSGSISPCQAPPCRTGPQAVLMSHSPYLPPLVPASSSSSHFPVPRREEPWNSGRKVNKRRPQTWLLVLAPAGQQDTADWCSAVPDLGGIAAAVGKVSDFLEVVTVAVALDDAWFKFAVWEAELGPVSQVSLSCLVLGTGEQAASKVRSE